MELACFVVAWDRSLPHASMPGRLSTHAGDGEAPEQFLFPLSLTGATTSI